jgi:probable HAF family extracellular repeat protein
MSDISNGSRSVAHGINDAGDVVGYFQTGGVLHAFIYDSSTGQRTDLGAAPGYPHSYGLAINQSGQVAGYVSTLFQPEAFEGSCTATACFN